MEKIIPPVPVEKMMEELTESKLVRGTNNGNNEIYIFTAHDSPNLMRELGRLREITFRDAGGGTGKELDIDRFDISDPPFRQLIVWNPRDKAIVGGYRFIHGKQIPCDLQGCLKSPTATLFHFSDHFIRDYLPISIELGRSFVQPEYQPTFNLKKGLYSLDNLWDGLGAIIIENPDVRHFFGKMTMYPHYNKTARDIVLFFLKKFFSDKEILMTPIHELQMETDLMLLEKLFLAPTFEENYKLLVQHVRKYNESIPPLVNAYMNLSSTMRTFGTAINHGFGEVEETGILITIEDIYHTKKERHLATYIRKMASLKNIRIRMKKPSKE